MCMLAPHLHMKIKKTQKPTYILHFGWGVNGLNFLYFVKYGPYPVFTESKY